MGDAEIEKPYLMISSPKRGEIYINGEKFYQFRDERSVVIGKDVIKADAFSPYGIERVEFYIDNRLVYTDEEAPYEYEMSRFSFWKHRIAVMAYDTEGEHSIDIMDIFWLNFGF